MHTDLIPSIPQGLATPRQSGGFAPCDGPKTTLEILEPWSLRASVIDYVKQIVAFYG